MTHGQSVIYLPPGVMPTQPPVQAQAPPSPNIPFNKSFFESVLPGAVKSFCEQLECDTPIVELFTVDGARHFVKGISGIADAFVALHTQPEHHEHPVQVFLPYQTIYRVEIHPEKDAAQRRLGFLSQVYDDGPEGKPARRRRPPALNPGDLSPGGDAAPVEQTETPDGDGSSDGQ